MKPPSPHERTYRSLVTHDRMETYRVVVKETDLLIKTNTPLVQEVTDLILKYRLPLERYVEDHPEFLTTCHPFPRDPLAPVIVRSMIDASRDAHVGPMAAVAGAIAECVGKDLIPHSEEVVVENGGDVFIHTKETQTVAIFAGQSQLSNKIGVRIDADVMPMAVCTSSGTIGHSLSLGKADAAVVVSQSTPLADAAATAIGNLVRDKKDIDRAIDNGRNINGVKGIVIIVNDIMGMWGDIELTPC